MSKLENAVLEFDGVAVLILSEARAACRQEPGYFEELIRLCCDPRPNVSSGATWILKAEADEGARFGPELIDRLLLELENISEWQAQLHICQSIDAFEFTADHAATLNSWATSLEHHQRPFLRGWSLHVRVVIGTKFCEFRPASELALKAAEDDKAASVRARARKLRMLLQSAKSAP